MVTHYSVVIHGGKPRLMSLDGDQHGLGYFQTLVQYMAGDLWKQQMGSQSKWMGSRRRNKPYLCSV